MARKHTLSIPTIILASLLLAQSALAQFQKSPACSQGETGNPIATTDEVWWPDVPGAIRIEVLANDYDLEGDPLKVTNVGTPAVGSAVATPDQQAVMYTPPATRPLADVSFSYTLSDGARTTPGTIRLLVAQSTPQQSLNVSVRCDNLDCFYKAEPVGFSDVRSWTWEFPQWPDCTKVEWRSAGMHCGFTNVGTYDTIVTAHRYSGESHRKKITQQVALKTGEAHWIVETAPPDPASAYVSESLEFIAKVTSSTWDSCYNCLHTFKFEAGAEGPVQRNSGLGWSGGTASYVYPAPGFYNVQLVVTGVSQPFSKQIEIRNKPPRLDEFQIGHPFRDQIDLIQLYMEPWDEHRPSAAGGAPGSVGPLAPKTVEIDWGDGTHTSVETPWGGYGYEHQYTAPGKYTVVARIVDSAGAVGTASDEVLISNTRPQPAFEFDCDPFSRHCVFDASASKDNGTIAQYQWKLSNAAGELNFTTTTPHLSTALTGQDGWTVLLTAKDDQGVAESISRTVRFPSAVSGPLSYHTMVPRVILDTRTDGQRVTPTTPRVLDLNACCGINLTGRGAAVINVRAIEPLWTTYPSMPVDILVAPGTQLVNEAPLVRYDDKLASISGNVVVTTSDGKFILGSKWGGGNDPYPYGVHLVVSLVGILAPPGFTPPSGMSAANRFVAVEPCRAFDTRFAPPRPAAGADRKVMLRGTCGIADDAVAITGGMAVVNPAATSPVNVLASSLSTANSTTAIDAIAGFNRGNGIWPTLGRTATDDLTLRVGTGSTDVILDATGYFRPAAAGGLRYVAVTPCLAGSVTLPNGRQQTVKIAGNCGVPPNAAAAVLTHRVSAPYFNGHLMAYGSYREPPVSSNGNYSASPVNAFTASTSVVKLNPSADGDAAFQANYSTAFPPPGPGSSPSQYHVTADVWVWGYFWDENYPPVARLTAQCTPPGPNCSFNASASTDDQGSILEYRWDFGDGTKATTATPTTSHRYASTTIEYFASVIAWDGVSSSAPATVAVNPNPAPVPRLAFQCSFMTCRFDASGSTDDGTIVKYEWIVQPYQSFFEGYAAWTYTYQNDWDYEVKLRVTDNRGKSATITRTVQVRGEAGIGPANFFTVPQCRIYDSGATRVSYGVVTFRGACGIPAGTDPIVPVVNFTIVSSESGSGEFIMNGKVPFTSAALPLAFPNLIPLRQDWNSYSFSVYPAAHVVADVVGYYRVSDAAQPAPARGPFRFTALDPCRVIDSRLTPPSLGADSRVDITVTGKCGIPAGAAATAQTLTGVNAQTPSFPSYMRLFPSHLTTVPTSAITLLHGTTRSNFFISELGTANGAAKDLAVWLNTGTADYVVDTHGYYSAGSKQKYNHLSYNGPLKETPAALQAGAKRTFKIKGQLGIPMHASAAVVHAEIANASAAGYLTLFAGDKTAPLAAALTFNANAATPAVNTVIVPLSRAADGDLAALASAGATLSLTVLGYFTDPDDWGTGGAPNIEWLVARQTPARMDLDITTISIDPFSPDHTYYVDWGDGTARWTADTGNALLTATPTHTYASGTFRDVTVAVVRRSDGAETKFTKRLWTGNAAPVASMTFDCTFAPNCTFDGSSSADDYNSIQSYRWTVAGTPLQTATPTLTHRFAGDGTYEVSLKVWDGTYESAAFTRTVQVRLAGPKTQYLFKPIRPCRVHDSRGGTPLTHNVSTTVKVTEGPCGVPATAKAVALTAAIVTPSADGNLRIFEPGKLTAVANITFAPGTSPRSNHATTAIGADGHVGLVALAGSATAPGTTHFILDVTGYYVADAVNVLPGEGVGFRTLTPCRIKDSRNAPQSPLVSGTPTLLKVRGTCGLPDPFPSEGAAAAAMNLTIVTAPTVGHVIMAPSDGPDLGSTTTVNVLPGRTTAGGATMGLGKRTGDDLSLIFGSTGPGNATHYILDTTGYWAAGNELRYYPIPGCRLLDTRQAGSGYPRPAAGTEYRVQVRGQCGIPSWAKAVMVNSFMIQPDSAGNLILWPAGTTRPVTSVLNWVAQEPAIGNMTIAPLGASLPDLSFFNSQSAGHLVLDVFGYFANPADVPTGFFALSQGEQEQ